MESFVWDLSRELARRGHDVTIIGGIGSRRESIVGVRILTYPFIPRTFWQSLPGFRRAYAEAKLLERLTMAVAALPELVRGRYDIIHIQKPYDMPPTLLARLLGGSARILLGCHGEDWYLGDWWFARWVDGAVSCSRFNAQTVANRYPLMPRVIFNGIDTTLFRPCNEDNTLRHELCTRGWPNAQHAPLLLSVGRLQPWKGVDVAIEALALIPDAMLLVAGDGEARPALQALAERRGVIERVMFWGNVARESLPRFYGAADVFLATSVASETFGITVVEAQACGLPVITTTFGGFPEVVDAGQTGLLVPPNDHVALANAIRSLLDDPNRRAVMAAAAPAWAAQFAWPAVVERVEEAYRMVLAGERGVAATHVTE